MKIYELFSSILRHKIKNMQILKLITSLLLFNVLSIYSSPGQVGESKIKTQIINSDSIYGSISNSQLALEELIQGNGRFLEGKQIHMDFKNQILQTKEDQHPHSFILSCIDSRIPPEIIFDQGIGKVFVGRVAGNISDPNLLGSMEFATKIKGAKLIVIMGHNKCGSVKGAIDGAEMGNLSQLVRQIQPAITGDRTHLDQMTTETAKNNVVMTINNILKNSKIIRELVNESRIKIVGAFYDVTSGKVSFFN